MVEPPAPTSDLETESTSTEAAVVSRVTVVVGFDPGVAGRIGDADPDVFGPSAKELALTVVAWSFAG